MPNGIHVAPVEESSPAGVKPSVNCHSPASGEDGRSNWAVEPDIPGPYALFGHNRGGQSPNCASAGAALSDNKEMLEAITRDPEVMHGTPVFRGTRVPVKTLFDYLENGETLRDFLEGFPTVSRELAIQVLEESKELRLARV